MRIKLITLLVTAALSAALVGCESGAGEQAGAFKMPPQQVDFVMLTSQDVVFTRDLPARAVASAVAHIRPQVTGIVIKRLFEEGGIVKAGQALYQIEDTLYQANLTSAKAELVRTQANLQASKSELIRYKNLLKSKASSAQKFELAQANYLAIKAELAVREAAIHRAQIDINYSKVLAPISGRISKSNITVGALVSAGQTQVLTTITQLDPIYFDLMLANGDLRNINNRLRSGELSETKQSATLHFSNGSQYPQRGELKFSEVYANPSTDTVTLRTQFSNVNHSLLPGMYGQIELVQALRKNSVLVPQKSVSFDRHGQASVFLIADGNKVEMRSISIGRSFGSQWLVLSGVEAGEKIITTGLQKIGQGMVVVPVIKDKKAG